MDALAAYDLIRSQLLLPDPILEVVAPVFKELGYPLERGTTNDWSLNTFDFYQAQSQGKKIVLLHIAGEVIGDPSQVLTISNIADVFLGKTDGLFFFAPIKDLNKAFNGLFAASFVRRPSGPQRVKFFDQGDIDDLKANELAKRKILIVFLLDVDKLLPPPNGSGSAPASFAIAQNRIVQILASWARIANIPTNDFFVQIRDQLEWPTPWFWEPKGGPDDCARTLVAFLIGQSSYPAISNKQGYTTVGFLLAKVIPRVGGGNAKELFDLAVTHKLIEIPDVLADLKQYL